VTKLPLVSIVIPTLNAAEVLENCLKSISEQDYPKDNLEIIIADGGVFQKTLLRMVSYILGIEIVKLCWG